MVSWHLCARLSGPTWEHEEGLGARASGEAPRRDCTALGQRLPVESSERRPAVALPVGWSRFRGAPNAMLCRRQAGAGPWSSAAQAQRWVVSRALEAHRSAQPRLAGLGCWPGLCPKPRAPGGERLSFRWSSPTPTETVLPERLA